MCGGIKTAGAEKGNKMMLGVLICFSVGFMCKCAIPSRLLPTAHNVCPLRAIKEGHILISEEKLHPSWGH